MYQILQKKSVNDMALHERSHYSECGNLFSNFLTCFPQHKLVEREVYQC